jgi:PrtD family type I secretion system ABC transporter
MWAGKDMKIPWLKWVVFAVFAFSVLINILYLTGSMFMLQVYDRVIPSRSVPTLVGLIVLAAGLYVFQALLDVVRARIFVRLARAFDRSVSDLVFNSLVILPLMTRTVGDGLQPVRDVATIRSFLTGSGPVVFFDLPWLPFFLALCFLFHFLIGLVATVGAAVLLILAIASEILTRGPVKQGALVNSRQLGLAAAAQRNAELLVSMGMTKSVRERWLLVNDEQAALQARGSDVAGGLSAISKAFRFLLQSAVLAVGAYLVINQQATGGIIIASSILTARALVPVELVISHWRGALAARQSWARLNALMKALPQQGERLSLPAPVATLEVEDLVVRAPGGGKTLVQGVRFNVKAGEAVGVIGPSGSGKSSLARALAGVWSASHGAVRLDGAPLHQWDRERLGAHIGYLPQDVELFAGTIAENIGRLAAPIESAAVIQAAQAAGVHNMILRFEAGYETQVGDQGALLSKGQRQRIALARALYNEPFLVILDEPNSNLDQEGDDALTDAILSVKARGGIAVVVAHRANAVSAVDHVLVMMDGRMQAFGPKDEVLKRVLARPAMPAAQPLNVAGPKDGRP